MILTGHTFELLSLGLLGIAVIFTAPMLMNCCVLGCLGLTLYLLLASVTAYDSLQVRLLSICVIVIHSYPIKQSKGGEF